MRTTASLALICWSLLFVSPSQAEVSEDVIKRVKADTFNHRLANVIYAIEQDDGWSVVSVYSQPFEVVGRFEPDGPKRWVAKRQHGHGEEFSDRVDWADSANCPQLEGALWSMTRIPVPVIRVPGLARPRPAQGTPPLLISTHGPVVTIWNAGELPSGAPSWLRLSSLGGELAEWGQMADENLADCWGSERPVA